MDEYINGVDFFSDITKKLRLYFDYDIVYPFRYILKISTVEYNCRKNVYNRYRIKKKNINTTIDILQDIYEENKYLKCYEKDLICDILQRIKSHH